MIVHKFQFGSPEDCLASLTFSCWFSIGFLPTLRMIVCSPAFLAAHGWNKAARREPEDSTRCPAARSRCAARCEPRCAASSELPDKYEETTNYPAFLPSMFWKNCGVGSHQRWILWLGARLPPCAKRFPRVSFCSCLRSRFSRRLRCAVSLVQQPAPLRKHLP